MNERANDFKTLVTFWDTQDVPVMSETGGNKVELINPRQEYGSLNPLKAVTIVNETNENIRADTHILTTRFRHDIAYFTTVTVKRTNPSFTKVWVDTFQVNSISNVGQSNQYLTVMLTIQHYESGESPIIGNVVTAGTSEVLA